LYKLFLSPSRAGSAGPLPVVLLVILLFSSHIILLTSIIGSDLISKNFFGITLPHSAHHLLLKGLATIPTLYCAKIAGSEGLYQLLILCPIMQAMFLPSSVIPLLRISSSRLIMGRYKISLYVEILAALAFLLMLFTNIIFAAEILFGDSTWTNNLKGNTGGPVLLPYIVMVLTSFATISFTLFLAVIPLKSASNEAESQELSVGSQRETLNIAHCGEETSPTNVALEEVQWSSADVIPKDSLEGHQKSALEPESSDAAAESDHEAQQPTGHRAVDPEARPSPSASRDETTFVEIDWTAMSKVCTEKMVEQNTTEDIHLKSATEKIVQEEPDVCTQKDYKVSHDLEFDKSSGGKASCFTSDGPPCLTLSRGDDTGAGNVSGIISRQSGLGRAARRQLATILDEFWGRLFDYHGKLTQEANTKRLNFFIGLDLRAPGSAVRKDSPSIEDSGSPMMTDAMRRSAAVLDPWDSRDKDISNLDTGFGLQMGAMGSPTWSQSMHLSRRDIPSSGRTFLEQSAKLYSNFHSPSYFDNQFYQPATIHGYQLANCLKASQSPYSSAPLDPWRPPRSSESATPSYTGSVANARTKNVLGSLGASSSQSPTLNRLSTMTVERSYYDPISIGGSESVGTSANSKKYHSSPDISAVIAAASRNALLNEADLGGPASNLAYLNERSQHNVQRDVLSAQLSMHANAKSLWFQQPFEHLFGVSSSELNRSDVNTGGGSSSASATEEDLSYRECEAELLHSLRFCIVKLLRLEGSAWLFSQSGGCDENLIDRVSEALRVSLEETSKDRDACRAPGCGDGCVWRAPLVVSFGVWCIHRVLDLSRVESRPELWGKYTYVLNRLQGIIEPAFSKPRKPPAACACLPKAGPVGTPIPGSFVTAAMILEVVTGVEQAVSGRRGRSGTAAGDVAFPKGKENLASVLKRYKRRLSRSTTCPPAAAGRPLAER
ncbi:hypothetical protein BS78_01G113800, partial [Paspalum vaginatum]